MNAKLGEGIRNNQRMYLEYTKFSHALEVSDQGFEAGLFWDGSGSR